MFLTGPTFSLTTRGPLGLRLTDEGRLIIESKAAVLIVDAQTIQVQTPPRLTVERRAL